MKKFNFPLQKVLEYNIHMQKKEKDILAILRSEYIQLENQLENLKKTHELYIQKYLKSSREGINITAITFILRYIKDLEKQIKLLHKKMTDKQMQIDKQIERLIEISKEKVTVEKLKDSKLEKYKAAERKNEELFIDELISFSSSIINI
ncbi:MAG: flagellar export protein FliJ [Clostridiales bacterium GWF2_36_10]|nr:MAG: flagellar export protein FliJ [Clostridiales bacterium GWF2_36_10]HAN20857.1 flagellar export protein FliJ [Clostridiales bacterium]